MNLIFIISFILATEYKPEILLNLDINACMESLYSKNNELISIKEKEEAKIIILESELAKISSDEIDLSIIVKHHKIDSERFEEINKTLKFLHFKKKVLTEGVEECLKYKNSYKYRRSMNIDTRENIKKLNEYSEALQVTESSINVYTKDSLDLELRLSLHSKFYYDLYKITTLKNNKIQEITEIKNRICLLENDIYNNSFLIRQCRVVNWLNQIICN